MNGSNAGALPDHGLRGHLSRDGDDVRHPVGPRGDEGADQRLLRRLAPHLLQPLAPLPDQVFPVLPELDVAPELQPTDDPPRGGEQRLAEPDHESRLDAAPQPTVDVRARQPDRPARARLDRPEGTEVVARPHGPEECRTVTQVHAEHVPTRGAAAYQEVTDPGLVEDVEDQPEVVLLGATDGEVGDHPPGTLLGTHRDQAHTRLRGQQRGASLGGPLFPTSGSGLLPSPAAARPGPLRHRSGQGAQGHLRHASPIDRHRPHHPRPSSTLPPSSQAAPCVWWWTCGRARPGGRALP